MRAHDHQPAMSADNMNRVHGDDRAAIADIFEHREHCSRLPANFMASIRFAIGIPSAWVTSVAVSRCTTQLRFTFIEQLATTAASAERSGTAMGLSPAIGCGLQVAAHRRPCTITRWLVAREGGMYRSLILIPLLRRGRQDAPAAWFSHSARTRCSRPCSQGASQHALAAALAGACAAAPAHGGSRTSHCNFWSKRRKRFLRRVQSPYGPPPSPDAALSHKVGLTDERPSGQTYISFSLPCGSV